MKLHFKQRFFSWFDSYDIYNEQDEIFFTVKGQLAWGHLFKIFDKNGNHIGTLRQQLFRFLPHYTMTVGDQKVGEIIKEFSFFKPKFSLSCNDWDITGDIMQWNYLIRSNKTGTIATISKELFHFTDQYTLDINNDKDALYVLMIVLAIDAIKCSNNNNL